GTKAMSHHLSVKVTVVAVRIESAHQALALKTQHMRPTNRRRKVASDCRVDPAFVVKSQPARDPARERHHAPSRVTRNQCPRTRIILPLRDDPNAGDDIAVAGGRK